MDSIYCSAVEFEEWKQSLITSLRQDQIHCPECVKHDIQAYKWVYSTLAMKSLRTPQEEKSMNLHRQKIIFLDKFYTSVCEIEAMKRKIKLHRLLAVNQLRLHTDEPAAVAAGADGSEDDLYG